MAESRPKQPRTGRPDGKPYVPGRPLFDLQQAAEKALKAVLLHRGASVIYTHNLQRLLDRVEQTGLEAPQPVAEAPYLTRFASLTRYPAADVVTPEEHAEAKKIAEAVVRWAETVVLGAQRTGSLE